MSNLAFLKLLCFDDFRKIVKTQYTWLFKKKGIVRWNVLNTMQPEGVKSVEKLRRYYQKTEKKSEKSSFCVKFDLVCGGAGLHSIAKRLGRPSFFIKRSHLSNIRVESAGVVATAWWVGVEWANDLLWRARLGAGWGCIAGSWSRYWGPLTHPQRRYPFLRYR